MKRILFLALCLLSNICLAAYPNGPLKMIVPFPAGGPTDVMARLVSVKLGEALGQPVYVENKAGAHGAIGMQAALAAPADGQTVVMVSIGTNGINPVLYKKSAYDVNKDFVPVSLLVTVPIVIVTRADAPYSDLAGLLAYAKANPGKLTFASAGNGGSSHLVPEMFMMRSGVDMVHVPYKGTAPAISDVLAGQVNLMFDTLLTSTQHIQSGKLKVIASTTAKRLPDYPKVPTVAESGYPGFEASSWYGLEVKAGTPPDIVKRLSTELAKIMKIPDVKERLDQLSTFAVGSTPEEFAKFQKAEQDKWGKVIQKGNIQPD
jgi:tripartite-type tricarboxylate transporter receptor subunit TctC